MSVNFTSIIHDLDDMLETLVSNRASSIKAGNNKEADRLERVYKELEPRTKELSKDTLVHSLLSLWRTTEFSKIMGRMGLGYA